MDGYKNYANGHQSEEAKLAAIMGHLPIDEADLDRVNIMEISSLDGLIRYAYALGTTWNSRGIDHTRAHEGRIVDLIFRQSDLVDEVIAKEPLADPDAEAKAYNIGFEDGFKSTQRNAEEDYNRGYDDGFLEGMDSDELYRRGYDTGYETGYDDGYVDAHPGQKGSYYDGFIDGAELILNSTLVRKKPIV